MTTEKIEWHAGLETELQMIDREHQDLVELLNRLIDLLTGGASHEQWLPLLDELVQHVADHFAHEEKVMENVGYPGTLEHRTHHRQLLQEVGQFRDQLTADGEIRDTLATVRFLKFWVLKHVVQEDMKIKQHVYRGLLRQPNGHGH